MANGLRSCSCGSRAGRTCTTLPKQPQAALPGTSDQPSSGSGHRATHHPTTPTPRQRSIYDECVSLESSSDFSYSPGRREIEVVPSIPAQLSDETTWLALPCSKPAYLTTPLRTSPSRLPFPTSTSFATSSSTSSTVGHLYQHSFSPSSSSPGFVVTKPSNEACVLS